MKYNDIVRSRTRDLPACRMVPQPLRYRVPTNNGYRKHFPWDWRSEKWKNSRTNEWHFQFCDCSVDRGKHAECEWSNHTRTFAASTVRYVTGMGLYAISTRSACNQRVIARACLFEQLSQKLATAFWRSLLVGICTRSCMAVWLLSVPAFQRKFSPPSLGCKESASQEL
jgi:hypothetical protein